MTNPTKNQIGGDHYAKLAIQPMEYALANGLNYAQANAIKYITRYKDKGGLEDLHKAIHCVELLIAFELKQASAAAGWTQDEIEKAAFKDAPSERWTEEDEARIDSIGQNGNTGEHYASTTDFFFSGCQRQVVVVSETGTPMGHNWFVKDSHQNRPIGDADKVPTMAAPGRYVHVRGSWYEAAQAPGAEPQEWEFSGCERDIVTVSTRYGSSESGSACYKDGDGWTIDTNAPCGRYLRQDSGKYRLEVR